MCLGNLQAGLLNASDRQTLLSSAQPRVLKTTGLEHCQGVEMPVTVLHTSQRLHTLYKYRPAIGASTVCISSASTYKKCDSPMNTNLNPKKLDLAIAVLSTQNYGVPGWIHDG
jgi:hypothetical protein